MQIQTCYFTILKHRNIVYDLSEKEFFIYKGAPLYNTYIYVYKLN